MNTLVPLLLVVLALYTPTPSVAGEPGSELCECPKPKQRRLFTLAINANDAKCLEFEYRIKPSADRILTVALKIGGAIEAPLWSAVAGSGKDWKNATLPVRKGRYNIVFDGVRHADRNGLVAIRDITLHDGACFGAVAQ
ncbi:MAM and LDL-receptor class A domain-containing protein 1-like [Lineus longissimus]|uniref:MAM and LDL-receptor class A domain-containing protein 1-like n=1 Tax=Lineus longissimus TaxID=88925 RepID=UPI002B4E5FC7